VKKEKKTSWRWNNHALEGKNKNGKNNFFFGWHGWREKKEVSGRVRVRVMQKFIRFCPQTVWLLFHQFRENLFYLSSLFKSVLLPKDIGKTLKDYLYEHEPVTPISPSCLICLTFFSLSCYLKVICFFLRNVFFFSWQCLKISSYLCLSNSPITVSILYKFFRLPKGFKFH